MIFPEITPEEVKKSLIHLPQLLLEVADPPDFRYSGTTGFMTFRQARTLIDYLVQLWESNPYGSYKPVTCFRFQGGEPLQNMLLIGQVIEYLEKLNIHRTFIYSIHTNVLLLDKYAGYLAEKHVRLHIHAGRNKDAANIHALQKAYPDYFTTHVEICPGRTGTDSPAGRDTGGHGCGLPGTGAGKPVSDIIQYVYQHSRNIFPDYNHLFMDQGRSRKCPAGTCPPFSKQLFVTAGGKILPCEKIERRFTFGEISRKGITLDFDLIAGKLNNYFNKIKKQCAYCYKNENCMQCLYFIPGISGKKPVCPGYMDKKAFRHYSAYCLGYLAKHPGLYERILNQAREI